MEKDIIRICDCHDEQVPLIWTFAFNGSEYWCPACGFNGGMFGSGTVVELTPELAAKEQEWKNKSAEFLSAKSTLVCSSLEWEGKRIHPSELPSEELEKRKKIISEWKYELE